MNEDMSEKEARKVYAGQEMAHLPYIPYLFKIVGIRLHCLLELFVVVLGELAKLAFGFVKSVVERRKVLDEKQKMAQRHDNVVRHAVDGFMKLYTTWFYNPISDLWNRPVKGAVGKTVDVMPRQWTVDHGVAIIKPVRDAPCKRCVNLGSYNYLGFGGYNEFTTPPVIDAVRRSGVALPFTPVEIGISKEQRELELAIATYMGKEDAIIVPMGFATNSMILPSLAGPGTLILSDALNHSSIITGLRLSGAKLRVCGHNDPAKLEEMLIAATNEKPAWKRILVVVEGLYSMEGECCLLPRILALCKHYGARLYIDEAHSVGAMGPNGRGICDYWGVDPADVDVLMGTFTKSFASIGGYVASDKKTIEHLRRNSLASIYGTSMAPGCAQQCLSALAEINTERGRQRFKQLRDNSILIRKRFSEAGCELLGPYDSPVIPVMVMHPWKLADFSRKCLHRGVAVVMVGYPATPVLAIRARLCATAHFNTNEVEEACRIMIDVAKEVGIDFRRGVLTDKPEEKNAKEEPAPREPCNFKSTPFVAPNTPQERPLRVIDPLNLPEVVLSSQNFLGICNTPESIETSVKVIEEYGCGSCGPRGFYGTTDKHLDFEERIRAWVDTEAAILYSYAALAPLSSLYAFLSEPTDVVVYDESISLLTKMGLMMCHCRCYPYPHNNMKALATILKTIDAEEAAVEYNKGFFNHFKKKPKKFFAPKKRVGRHFIVTDGVFVGSGDIAPLPELIALKNKHDYLLYVDESLSMGTLGSTGRGLREYWAEKTNNPELAHDRSAIDLLVGSMETSVGSVGGFCAGPRCLIQHQVLNGLGYVFSASEAPYLCQAGVEGINSIDCEAGSAKLAVLHENSRALHEMCRKTLGDVCDVSGTPDSPVRMVTFRRGLFDTDAEELAALEKVEDACFADGVAVCVARFADFDEAAPKHPALKIAASALYSKEQYQRAVDTISAHLREQINH